MRLFRRLFVLSLVAITANLTPAYAGTRPERGEVCNLRCRWYTGVARQQAAAVALLEQTRAQDAAANAGNAFAIVAVAARFFPPDALPRLVVVIRHESGFNPRALNPNGMDSGLTQLRLPLHADLFVDPYCTDWRTARFDAVCNLHAAGRLHAGAGWAPWRGAFG